MGRAPPGAESTLIVIFGGYIWPQLTKIIIIARRISVARSRGDGRAVILDLAGSQIAKKVWDTWALAICLFTRNRTLPKFGVEYKVNNYLEVAISVLYRTRSYKNIYAS